MRSAVVLLTLALATSANAAAVPFPGGVADEHADRAFVAGARGGTEAIALADGAIRWRSPSAGRPLALVGPHLLTWLTGRWPSQIRFAVVDASNGHVLQTLPSVILPMWVAVAPAFAHTFACEAVVDGQRVHVRWRATAAWSQGMHPSEGQEAAARREGSGVVDVDLANGRVEVVAKPPTAVAPPPGATLDGRHLLERDGARWNIVDARSHARVASLALADGFGDATVVGGRLYVVRNGVGLEAIDLADGRVRWRRAPPRSTPVPLPQ